MSGKATINIGWIPKGMVNPPSLKTSYEIWSGDPATSIKVVRPPNKTVYAPGEEIDMTGAHIFAYDDNNNIVYRIPLNELTIEPTVASDDGGSVSADEEGQHDEGAYYIATGGQDAVCTQSDGTGGLIVAPSGAKYCGIVVGSDFHICAIHSQPFTMESYTFDGELEDSNQSEEIQHGGETYYYASDYWYEPSPTPSINYSILPDAPGVTVKSIAMSIILGASGHRMNVIAVKWPRPADKQVLTTTFSVRVGEDE